MKVKTTDSVHISSVQAAVIPGETVIEVTEEVGKSLIDRGLATKVKTGTAKKAPAPANKMAAVTKNKAASSSRSKR